MKIRKRKHSLPPREAVQYGDGIMNMLTRVSDVPGVNTSGASFYTPNFKTLNRQQCEWAYTSSWVAGMAVDCVAEDMTREGCDYKCDENPALIEPLERDMEKFHVYEKLCSAIKWARLYGGAAAIILIEGQPLDVPITAVPRDSFRGLHVLDRWCLEPDGDNVITTLGVNFGKPEYYRIIAGNLSSAAGRVHHSRVVRFEGQELPFYLAQSYQSWGASVLERVWPKIQQFDYATQGAAQLVSKAYLRNVKIKGFRDMLGLGSEQQQAGFMAQMKFMAGMQSQEGLTIMDSEDDFQAQTYSFAGLNDILTQFGQQIAGALQIPTVRLFGESPAGMNATGESDLRTYYDSILRQQETILRPALKRIFSIMLRSETGMPAPDSFSFDFTPLWQMTSEQRAQSAQQLSGTILQAMEAGALSKASAVKELKLLSSSVGVFSSITDEDVQAAEQEDALQPPPMPAMPGDPAQGAAPEQQAQPVAQAHSQELKNELRP